MISLQTLVKIASVTGAIVGTTGYGLRFKIQSEVRESKLYKEAIQYLNNHQKALELLGTPIQEKRVNISDYEQNGSDDDKTWLTIPIKGSQNSGKLRVEAFLSKDLKNNLKADIYKVELTIKEMPNKVFVMKDDSATVAN